MLTLKYKKKKKLFSQSRNSLIKISQNSILVFFVLFIFFVEIAFAGKPSVKPPKKDKSPPRTPVVVDDGQYTNSSSQLHAVWTSKDPQSGIAEYRYSIGTNVGLTDVVDWTSIGTEPEVTATALTLVNGQICFFNVRAKNGVNLWSEVGFSDGITVLIPDPPQIISLVPMNNSTFIEGDLINIVVQAQGSPPLEYRYLVEGSVVQDWISLNTYSWQTQIGDVRQKSITVDVRDMYQATTSQDTNVFLFRKPPNPE